jgi:hypothetical protein
MTSASARRAAKPALAIGDYAIGIGADGRDADGIVVELHGKTVATVRLAPCGADRTRHARITRARRHRN